MIPAEGHLNFGETEQAADRPSEIEASTRAHLETCERCRAAVAQYRQSKVWLEEIRVRRSNAATKDCIDENGWADYLSDRLTAAETDAVVEHAASCGHCGAVLAEITGENSETDLDPTPALASDTVEWRKVMAQKIAFQTKARRSYDLPWKIAAAAAVVVILAGGFVWWHFFESGFGIPTKLLTKAYSEHRGVELRFPGADYGPLRTTRGAAEASRFEQPAALLEAEARIARGLPDHPHDPRWLLMKAQLDLLRWNYSAAQTTLDRALQVDPDSIDILQALAMSFFEAAEVGGDSLQYGKAADLWSRVLQKEPGNRTALFNRALAYERLKLFHEAANDWERLLRAEPAGGWAKEARQHLDAVRRKLSRNERPFAAPPEPGDVTLMDRVRTAFGTGSDHQQTALRAALAVTADDLVSRYQDAWLKELMAGAPSPESIDHLNLAVSRGQAGDAVTAEREGRLAVAGFERVRNVAGIARARYEVTYESQRLSKPRECLKEGGGLANSLRLINFAWLRAQIFLEMANCLNMLGDFAGAEKAAAAAVVIAEEHGLQVQRLRSIGIHAAILTAMVRSREAWAMDLAGLTTFWEGSYPPIRAYQFYDDMSVSAERRGDHFLARALSSEAVAQIAQTDNRPGEAIARAKLGRLALQAGNVQESRAQFSTATAMFEKLAPGNFLSIGRIDGEIGLARVEARMGDARGALRRLQAVVSSLRPFDNYIESAQYYRALAEIHEALGNRAEREKALKALVAIAETGLASIDSGRNRLLWAQELDEAYRGLVRSALERGDPDQALEIWEWYRAAELRKMRDPQSLRTAVDVASLEESNPQPSSNYVHGVARGLENVTFVTIAQMPDGIASWTYDKRGVFYRWIPIPEKIVRSLAQNLAVLCSTSASSHESLTEAGRRVYQAVIAPLANRWIPGRPLVLDIDGPLSQVPFEVLPLPDGSILCDRFPIVLSPGVQYYAAATYNRRDGGRALIVGSPQLDPRVAAEFEPLPEAREEADQVASLFPNHILLTGPHATKSAVQQAVIGASIFHFAGHAISSVEQSGLLLAGDQPAGAIPGLWSAADLGPNSLVQCKLAVLAACSTGQMNKGGLSEPGNLARTLLAAGVRNVVASRWAVDSRSTRLLMNHFYQAVNRGAPPAEALRIASAALRGRKETNHPFYWAAFSVFGVS